MKAIFQLDKDGEVYAYFETEEHFKKTEPLRAKELTRRTRESLAWECLMQPGEYVVVDVKGR